MSNDSKKDIEDTVRKNIKKKLHEHAVEEKILAEIDKDLGQLIELEVKETLEKEFGQLKEGSQEEAKSEGASQETFAEEPKATAEGQQADEESENAEEFVKPFRGFRRYFHICWRGICRPISWVMIMAYLLIIALMFVCPLFNITGICLSGGPLGASSYIGYVAIIAFLISIILAFLSSHSRTALIFSALLSIPLLIIVFISFVQYIGLILIFLVLFNFIIQNRSSGY